MSSLSTPPPDADVLLHEDAERGLRVLASSACSVEFLELLQRSTFGTEGVRYRRLGLSEQLGRLTQASYVELREHGRLLGTYVLVPRLLRAGNQEVKAIYRSLLTLPPEAQGRGLGRYLVDCTFQWLAARAGDDPMLSWGCIERNNSRSSKLLKSLGAVKLGSLDSLLAYRQWPRVRIGMEELCDSEALANALQHGYGDCGLQGTDSSTDRYFAVTDADGIVVGARATLTHIDMRSSGSAWDVLYERLLRWVPAARRRYDPKNFRYLRLSDVVVRPGRERVWRDFLGTLLARHEAHMAMFVLDTRGRVYAGLKSAGVFGRFSDSTRQRIDVLANSWNYSSASLASLAEQPLALGPLDI